MDAIDRPKLWLAAAANAAAANHETGHGIAAMMMEIPFSYLTLVTCSRNFGPRQT